jgi:hypothetical protein
MEKRNVVETRRTPEHELTRKDVDWDKQAADAFQVPLLPEKTATGSKHGSK